MTVYANVSDAAERFRASLPPVFRIAGETDWYAYDEKRGIYVKTQRDLFLKPAKSFMTIGRKTAKNAEEMVRTAQIDFTVERNAMFGFMCRNGDALMYNCRNGVLQIPIDGHGKPMLLPHTPDYRFTRQLAAGYNPNATCPCYERIIFEALPDEQDRQLNNAFAGYTLLPDCRHNICLYGYGPTHTGKSTIWEYAIGTTLGKDVVTELSLSALCDEKSYGLPGLQHAALNLGVEAPASEMSESANFKQITEGSTISVREIYGMPFPMSGYQVKLVFLGNHLPRFRSGTNAEAARIRFLHFKVVHDGASKDPTLWQKLADEKDGIFSTVIVPQLLRLLAGDPMPAGGEKGQDIMQRFATDNDPVQKFIITCLEFGPDKKEKKDDIHRAWKFQCETDDLSDSVRNRSRFFRLLRQRCPEIQDYRPHVETGPGMNSPRPTRDRWFKGVQLKESAPMVPDVELEDGNHEY
jgi:P4 family phage/plasmid primase-like protien